MGSAGRGTMVEEFHAFKVTVGGDSGLIFAFLRWVRGGACTLEINWSHFRRNGITLFTLIPISIGSPSSHSFRFRRLPPARGTAKRIRNSPAIIDDTIPRKLFRTDNFVARSIVVSFVSFASLISSHFREEAYLSSGAHNLRRKGNFFSTGRIGTEEVGTESDLGCAFVISIPSSSTTYPDEDICVFS